MAKKPKVRIVDMPPELTGLQSLPPRKKTTKKKPATKKTPKKKGE